MLTYKIKATSKNPKALKLFFLFCFQNKIFNFQTTFYKIKNKKKVITVLKSPHVNKKAQAQLEYRFFSAKIKIVSSNNQSLLILKKIKTQLFPEIKLTTKLIVNKQNYFQLQTNALNPKNYIINNLNQYKTQKAKLQKLIDKKTITYIKIFDCFGELNITKNTYIYNYNLFR